MLESMHFNTQVRFDTMYLVTLLICYSKYWRTISFN